MPLAQFNIARARWPLDDPRMAGFTDNIHRMNAMAARFPGFLWSLGRERPEDAKAVTMGDPLMTWTLSVWESPEALARFAFDTVHVRFFRKREAWFPVLDVPAIVMWEIADDHRPDLAEAEARHAWLAAHGPTDHAFGWERFPHLRARRDAAADPSPEGAPAP
jgi:Domain of unknown function (DUF3291).